MSLPTIATFTTYDRDGSARTTDVLAASVGISGRAGAWGVHVAILLAEDVFGPATGQGPGIPSGRYYRQLATRRTRELARRAARTVLADHLGTGFTGARLRINGRDRGTL